MKLRVHAGSVRLRLSQSDVRLLDETGKVEDAVVFGPGRELRYAIETGGAEIGATLDETRIRVTVPAAIAKQWIDSDQTGIESTTGTLRVLIEKDFQCLHRPPEPGEDSFANPLAAES
jgi:hypothetical protein